MFHQFFKRSQSLKSDVLSGLTVALALVPEAVAFAFVAGVDPLVGLYAAFLVGLITSIFGGRPGMISGATGAMAVVMVALVVDHGVEFLFATVVLTGIIQILAGVFKLGKFIRMVPHPVMLGFVNGLAIVIFLAQIKQFKTPIFNSADQLAEAAANGVKPDNLMAWLPQSQLMIMIGLIVLTMAIIHFLPKLTKAIPSTLVAILVVTGVVIGFGIETPNVSDVLVGMSQKSEELKLFSEQVAINNVQPELIVEQVQAHTKSMEGGLPQFHLPVVPFTLETLLIIFPYAFVLAAIGLIESLLTLTLIDEITETRGRGNKECVGQGMANFVTGFFGGMGGCAMIGQSIININSGGRGRASGISAAIFLLAFIMFAAEWIEMIPIAALTGVMFIVVIGTFEWASLRLWGKVPRADVLVIAIVAGVTVMYDLAIAVLVGVIVSALVFAWQHAKHMIVATKIEEDGTKVYFPTGPLFFGSVRNFLDSFDPQNDPQNVIVDFANSRVADHSGLEAVDGLAERYKKYGKDLHYRHLSEECRKLMATAGDLVEVNYSEDPKYKVADDSLA